MSVISPAGMRSADGTTPDATGSRLRDRLRSKALAVFSSDDGEGDEARVQRIGARFLGAGVVGYLLVSLGTIGQAADLTAPWWPPLSVLLCIGPGVALIAYSFRPGTAWLTPLAVTAAACYLLAVGLWFVAWTGQTTANPQDSAVWVVVFPGMPSMVLMLVHPRWGVANLVAACAAMGSAQQLGRFGRLTTDLPVEMVWAIAFTVVFLAVALVAVRTGRTLDETREDTYRGAAEVAATAARDVEKARLDGIIHDRIIASLLAVQPGVPDQRLADQASSALAEIARLAEGGDPEHAGVLAPDEAIRRIRSAAADVTDRAEVEIVADDPTRGDVAGYPVYVVQAVVEALAEALRNVVRHAGDDADCAVIAQLTEGAISMAVVDDGHGFDPDATPPGRLGIQVSIRTRMVQVGGAARVSSRPGRGTTVQLLWERP